MTDTMSALVHKDHNVEIPGLDRTDEIGRMAAAIKYFRSESIEKVKLAKEHTVFLEALGDGIFGLDLDGRATFVNPAAAKMLGYEVDELVGKSLFSIVRGAHGLSLIHI